MKIYFKTTILIFAVILMSACQQDDFKMDTPRELTFSSQIQDQSTNELRLAVNDFFQIGFGIDVTIWPTNNAPEQSFIYYYSTDGIFRGDPGYHFTMDDNYIDSLKAIWPLAEIRQQPFITDQRELQNYRLADWMTASSTAQGIMPTDKPVPLNFMRENTLLEFELAGQNTEGLDIESLVIELRSSGAPIAYW
ncbi:MAG TPA: hypothetical protein DIT04_11065, partial [Dysgonomonas sp.]|nr:hypothetical protein [Dysgonomonas sp.]